MADADDKLDFCKQALGEIGTRSTITALDPPDGSQEAYYCNLFFAGTRDQVLRAAHWSFAGASDRAPLWKALPGTPENPAVPAGYGWSNRDPAPPWLYSYLHKGSGLVQIRRLRPGVQSSTDPFFGGVTTGFDQTRCLPFEIASDFYDRSGNALSHTKQVVAISITNPGLGYRPGDYIVMTGTAVSQMGQPVTLEVVSVNTNGSVTFVLLTCGGSFAYTPIEISQSATTGSGTGFACTVDNSVTNTETQKVILSDARDVIIDYTSNLVQVAQYDASFGDAFMVALAGKLALALTGDKELYKTKLQQANAMILEARVRDGNEGLTQYDHVPDWLQVRGVAAMQPASGWFNPPYGPLFAV